MLINFLFEKNLGYLWDFDEGLRFIYSRVGWVEIVGEGGVGGLLECLSGVGCVKGCVLYCVNWVCSNDLMIVLVVIVYYRYVEVIMVIGLESSECGDVLGR